MLILRRRAGQSILIGPDVEIQIVAIGPAQVKVGIIAPDDVTVARGEVRVTREQNMDAARGLRPEHLPAFFERLRSGFRNSGDHRQYPDSPVNKPETCTKNTGVFPK